MGKRLPEQCAVIHDMITGSMLGMVMEMQRTYHLNRIVHATYSYRGCSR